MKSASWTRSHRTRRSRTRAAVLAGTAAAILLGAPPALARDWLSAFDALHRRFLAEGFAPLRPAWKAVAAGLGLPLEARLAGGQVLRGRFVDLGEDGSLLLEIPGEARPRAVAAGEIFFPGGGTHAAGH